MVHLTPEQISMLSAAVDTPADSDVRRSIGTMLGGTEPLPGRHWTQFPFHSVVSFILHHAGESAAAVQVLAKHGALLQPDNLATALIGNMRQQFYGAAMFALHRRRPDITRLYLDATLKTFGNAIDVSAERSLGDIIAYAEAAGAPKPPVIPPRGRPTVVSLCVWGEPFIQGAARAFLPCCLAPESFPAMKEYGTVYLRVHTRAEDAERILSLPVSKELARHVTFDIVPIPPAILEGVHIGGRGPWNRMLIAASQHADLMFARSIGGDYMLSATDILMSSGCYTAAKRRLVEGYTAVVLQMARVTSAIFPLLEAQGCHRGEALDIPSEVLYRASTQTLHPFIFQSFMRQAPSKLPVDPVHFYFPTAKGFVHRSPQLNALAVAAGRLPADLICDFNTSDTRLVSDVLVGQDRERLCYMQPQWPGEMFGVSIDSDAGVASFGNFELSPAGAAEATAKWVCREEDLDYFIWALGHRFEYELPAEFRSSIPPDCIDERQAMAEIVRLVEQKRPEIVADLARLKR